MAVAPPTTPLFASRSLRVCYWNAEARVVDAAERVDHHPDIDIRHTRVTCALSTHDAGGITEKDLVMARKIDGLERGA